MSKIQKKKYINTTQDTKIDNFKNKVLEGMNRNCIWSMQKGNKVNLVKKKG